MFVLLGPLIVIGIVVAIVVAAVQGSRRSHHGSPLRGSPPPGRPLDQSSLRTTSRPGELQSDLEKSLDRWTAAGLLTSEQSAAITEFEQRSISVPALTPEPPQLRRRGIPPVAEALGYLGGVLAVVGLVLAIAGFWRDMSSAGRLALGTTAAIVLFAAGQLVHEQNDPALARLRSFLWLASTAAVGVDAGVLTLDVFDNDSRETLAMACSAAVAAYSGLLWSWRNRPLQQAACLVGIATFAGATTAQFTGSGPAGMAVWTVGVAFLALGLWRRTPQALLTEGIGAVSTVVGAGITLPEWPGFGIVCTLVTAGGLLAISAVPGIAAARSDQLLNSIVGGLALLQSAPSAILYFGHRAGVITGLVTWLVGAALITLGWRRLVRAPTLAEIVGGVTMVGGGALTGVQWHGFAPLFGIATGIGLIALGMVPRHVLMSIFGSLGLLVNLPWAIGWYFPGEGRAPRLILATGVVIIAVAVLLTRMGGRFRRELGGSRPSSLPGDRTKASSGPAK